MMVEIDWLVLSSSRKRTTAIGNWVPPTPEISTRNCAAAGNVASASKATQARRRANATYFQSHSVDAAQMINFGVDLTPLIHDDKLDPAEYIGGFVKRFADDVNGRVKKFS